MTVQKTSVFPADADTVLRKLQQLETLQYVACPFASFEPLDDAAHEWEECRTSSYRLRLFGVIPFGIHTIHIVHFGRTRISSREKNSHVPVWDHDITLEPLDAYHTRYTDRVRIEAGRKTFLIWLWANAFYAHRQRRWKRLLREEA